MGAEIQITGLQKYKLKRRGQTNKQTDTHTHQYHDSAGASENQY